MSRCQGDTCEVCIGAFSQWTKPRQAPTIAPGPLSVNCGSRAACVSDGVSEGASQYGLASAKECFVFALADRRSDVPAVMDTFRSVPTCSWKALIVRRKLRANHRPAKRKANCARRLPTAYQLISDQELKSFIVTPLGRDSYQVSLRNRGGELAGSPRNGQVC